MLNGIIIIDKPQGKTSHDMVSWCRRLFKQKRVGHTGTLDPAATGVLPLCLGEATRLAEYLTGQDKVYWAELCFGFISTTYDGEGELSCQPNPFRRSVDDVEALLPRFRGEIEQKPPLYSAISQGGKRLYQLARAGVEVELPLRKVRIDEICIQSRPAVIEPGTKLELQVSCGKGTYIRSLAHDIGEALGCGAYLSGLRRLRSGLFGLEQAQRPEELEKAMAATKEAETLLLPLRADQFSLPWLQLSAEEEKHTGFGRSFAVETGRLSGLPMHDDEAEVLLLHRGAIRAVGRIGRQRDEDRLVVQPHKVFQSPLALQGGIWDASI